jgi:nitrite reductase/ring-hydroxylating ferredoxin subunit
MKLLRLGNKRIVWARTEDGYVVFDDRCTHKRWVAGRGRDDVRHRSMSVHGSQFDVSTGEVKAGPANNKIDVCRVKEGEGGEIDL